MTLNFTYCEETQTQVTAVTECWTLHTSSQQLPKIFSLGKLLTKVSKCHTGVFSCTRLSLKPKHCTCAEYHKPGNFNLISEQNFRTADKRVREWEKKERKVKVISESRTRCSVTASPSSRTPNLSWVIYAPVTSLFSPLCSRLPPFSLFLPFSPFPDMLDRVPVASVLFRRMEFRFNTQAEVFVPRGLSARYSPANCWLAAASARTCFTARARGGISISKKVQHLKFLLNEFRFSGTYS